MMVSKQESPLVPGDENRVIQCAFLLTWYQVVTDGRRRLWLNCALV